MQSEILLEENQGWSWRNWIRVHVNSSSKHHHHPCRSMPVEPFYTDVQSGFVTTSAAGLNAEQQWQAQAPNSLCVPFTQQAGWWNTTATVLHCKGCVKRAPCLHWRSLTWHYSLGPPTRDKWSETTMSCISANIIFCDFLSWILFSLFLFSVNKLIPDRQPKKRENEGLSVWHFQFSLSKPNHWHTGTPPHIFTAH